eukprot:CAMPEP_0174990484 /NCGR_PEP_ID=MMETSP0004_2-20121128/21349_1 /TAXON_ID=420556 /ORGANISM="Ochromonas sp., Strain CCMP1393" /LENGTH=294 /DNA_ID=CAMNT_0016244101 /DNA_START=23 /DNA_END=904 /DNA_ORIENTATION=-
MSYSETDRLVLTIDELNSQSDDNCFEFVSPNDAFFDQPLYSFVTDEVHAMMRILFCSQPQCLLIYNPLYLLAFFVLFTLTFPGAILHWLLISHVPVRATEDLEEREIRCQGIYTAMGTALLSIPYSILELLRVSKYVNSEKVEVAQRNSILLTVYALSLYVDACIIFYCLIGLKAICNELKYAVRTFAVCTVLVGLMLVAFLLFDVRMLLTSSIGNPSSSLVVMYALQLCLNIFAIFITSIISSQSFHFWDLYQMRTSRKQNQDLCLVGTLVLSVIGIVSGLTTIMVMSANNDW